MALPMYGESPDMTSTMPICARRILRHLAGETRAAEIAEAAAVLPLMFMVLLGIFWFGQAFSIYGTITRAAQEGARAGAAPQCTTCGTAWSSSLSAQNAANAVQAALAAAKLDASNARQPFPTPPVYSCNGQPVSCDTNAGTNICVQTSIQLSNTASGGTGVCGISVSFQYPFQFWLPFTPLNKQQIWLTATARARVETQ
jgi:Flp pilus assembly protein TadG